MLHFQVLLVVLCSSVLLVPVSGAPRREQLTEILQEDLVNDKDPSRLLLLSFMSELMASKREEMLRELEDEEVGEERERLMRRQIHFTHRERKPGCRNFYWKTFTSC